MDVPETVVWTSQWVSWMSILVEGCILFVLWSPERLGRGWLVVVLEMMRDRRMDCRYGWRGAIPRYISADKLQGLLGTHEQQGWNYKSENNHITVIRKR